MSSTVPFWSTARHRYRSRPLIRPRAGATPTQLGGLDRSELGPPAPDRLVGHHHAAGQHHLLDLAEAQRKPEVQPDTVVDDLDRVAWRLYERAALVTPGSSQHTDTHQRDTPVEVPERRPGVPPHAMGPGPRI